MMMMVMLLEEADAGKRKSKGRLVKDRSNNGLAITIFNPVMDCAENIVSNNCEILGLKHQLNMV